MKALVFLIALAAARAQPPELAGVWVPHATPDIASKAEVPLTPAAKAKFLENNAAKQSETDLRCLPPGVPRIMFTARAFQIVETRSRIMFLYEGGGHVWRQIWMDGRAHPNDPNPDWLGHSIGHWDGKTLVVDTIGFNDRTWLDDAGHPHTEQLHVIERLTRSGRATIAYDVTIDDPGAYTRPWTVSGRLSLEPNGRMAEDICLDRIAK
jgi:hypothetical protein